MIVRLCTYRKLETNNLHNYLLVGPVKLDRPLHHSIGPMLSCYYSDSYGFNSKIFVISLSFISCQVE